MALLAVVLRMPVGYTACVLLVFHYLALFASCRLGFSIAADSFCLASYAGRPTTCTFFPTTYTFCTTTYTGKPTTCTFFPTTYTFCPTTYTGKLTTCTFFPTIYTGMSVTWTYFLTTYSFVDFWTMCVRGRMGLPDVWALVLDL